MSTAGKKLLVTACAFANTTERAARRRGVGYFLPALFVDRFSNLGGIDKAVFAAQLDACRSFEDLTWANYWRGLAAEHTARAETALGRLNGPRMADLLEGDPDTAAQRLRPVLSPAVEVFAERRPENAADLVASFTGRHPEYGDAAVAIDALVKAMTYLFAASWPGWTPRRLAAYRDSRRIFDVLLHALGPAMGLDVERLEIRVDDETVTACMALPRSADPVPAVLVTNGLEGTTQEVVMPVLRLRDRGMAMIMMEMPGTFAYRKPLSVDSERIYRAVLDHIVADPRIDAGRIGIMGLSFGAHWSTRMAARDGRLKAAVSNGGPYHRSFQVSGAFGMPEIMLSTLRNTTGAKSLLGLGRKLRAFSIRDLYSEIAIPLLVINGDTDTLISTRDSVDLAEAAPLGELKLYPHDDHCAMGHYSEWMDYSLGWLAHKLHAHSAKHTRA
ncbi:S9 family peptidase [Streptomyces sp. GbtcB6]|uniref:alpha/beta hydrolase family protein n=1 Tax=Streptomyces sp. GbtcB6 TaxID=2824751 RepID=UPI001C3108DA|nr:alpha/beta hydrolase [Streptomyces sp. GbtcB6]